MGHRARAATRWAASRRRGASGTTGSATTSATVWRGRARSAAAGRPPHRQRRTPSARRAGADATAVGQRRRHPRRLHRWPTWSPTTEPVGRRPRPAVVERRARGPDGGPGVRARRRPAPAGAARHRAVRPGRPDDQLAGDEIGRSQGGGPTATRSSPTSGACRGPRPTGTWPRGWRPPSPCATRSPRSAGRLGRPATPVPSPGATPTAPCWTTPTGTTTATAALQVDLDGRDLGGRRLVLLLLAGTEPATFTLPDGRWSVRLDAAWTRPAATRATSPRVGRPRRRGPRVRRPRGTGTRPARSRAVRGAGPVTAGSAVRSAAVRPASVVAAGSAPRPRSSATTRRRRWPRRRAGR